MVNNIANFKLRPNEIPWKCENCDLLQKSYMTFGNKKDKYTIMVCDHFATHLINVADKIENCQSYEKVIVENHDLFD